MVLRIGETEAVRRAVHQNMVSFWRMFPSGGASPGWQHEAGVDSIDFGIPNPILTGVLGSRMDADFADGTIAHLISRFRSTNRPWSWIVGPNCRPSDVGHRLESQGMQMAFSMPGMAIDLDDWIPPKSDSEVQVDWIENGADLESWLEVCFGVFDIPGEAKSLFQTLHRSVPIPPGDKIGYVVGLLDGRPVSTTSYFLGDGVVGIYCVATLEEARGKGIASALVSKCLSAGRDRGYHVGILQSSSKGFNAYRRLGFEEVCRFQVFVDPSG